MKQLTSHTLLGASLVGAIFLGGCATGLQSPQAGKVSSLSPYDAPSRAELDAIPEPIPQVETIRSSTTQPYQVSGKTYTPFKTLVEYKERGAASWYGQRYQGKQTASGEPYDMYKMTAAHPILPIPSYARVSNLSNGKSIIVRINDRGPFIDNRVIDVSYVAAYKLGMLEKGTQEVEVQSIIPAGAPVAQANNTAYSAQTYPVQPQQQTTPQYTQPAAANTTKIAYTPPPAQTYPVSQAPTSSPSAAQPVASSEGGEEVVIQPLQNNSTTPSVPTPIPLPSFSDGQATPVVERPGVYIQLGAFRTPESAENLRQRFLQQVLNNNNVVQVVIRDGYYKVHVGPFESREQATEVNQRLYQMLNLNGMIINKQ